MRQIKNKQAKYSNVRWFNNCCAQALHEPTERLVEAVGATLKTGGKQDFIKRDMNHAAELRRKQKQKNNARLTRLADHVISADKTAIKSSGTGENG